MEAGFRLQDSKIAIIGLGLMGGSLALALKGKCAALYGIDLHPATRELALANQIVDQASPDPTTLLPQADIIILATPVPAILDFINQLPLLTQNPCIVLDLGSTKRDILEAMSTLPDWFDPIGGHPICGKEKLGLENAEGKLYQDAAFVVTVLQRTTPHARSAVEEIVSVIGAHLIEMTADEHDCALASTSHLPFLLSSALALSTSAEYFSLIGPGFRSTSRLAGTSSHIMMGILKTNRNNVLEAIQNFCHSLNEIELALQNENYTELDFLLNQSRASHHSLIEN